LPKAKQGHACNNEKHESPETSIHLTASIQSP
jgi:hypothetical protein